MTDRLSTVPPFSIAGETFRCWITDDGQRYEWRAVSGHASAGRNPGSATCWARVGSREIGRTFTSLRLAMFAAAQTIGRRAA